MLCQGSSDVRSVNCMSDIKSRNTESPVEPGLVTFGTETGGISRQQTSCVILYIAFQGHMSDSHRDVWSPVVWTAE